MKKQTFALLLSLVCTTGLWVACNPTPKQTATVPFNCFGKDTVIRFDSTGMTHLQVVDSANIAECKAWLQTATTETAEDLLALKEELQLADWMFMKTVERFSEAALGATNEAQVLTHVLMAKAGFGTKLCCSTAAQKVSHMFPTQNMVYNRAFFNIDSLYWVLNDTTTLESSFILPAENGKNVNMTSNVVPNLPYIPSEPRTIKARDFEDFAFTVSINQNLMAYYDNYMRNYGEGQVITQWTSMCEAPMDPRLQQELIDPMKEKLKDKTQHQAVSMLMNWVQTGLEYRYDEDVWGYDRPFFAEETLFYPYADAEDRSILLAQLIHHVLDLPMVFIYYPGHTALGVSIDGVTGDFVMDGGQKFFICDPTYIGSWPGQEMPNMDIKKATVRRLYSK